jgi:TPR repeat protein
MRFSGRSLRWFLPFVLVLLTTTQMVAQDTTKPSSATIAKLTKQAESGDALAQFSLGVAYATGEGVPKDEVEAARWYRKAAEQGFVLAQNRLGRAYAYGKGVVKDATEAVRWYLKAAEQGYADAQCSLGLAYATGEGVPKDEAEAVRWYRKAAEQSNPLAQGLLGVAYAYGGGVRKANKAEAYFWLNLGASALDEKFRAERDRIGETLTRKNRLEIQERCRKWSEAHAAIDE